MLRFLPALVLFAHVVTAQESCRAISSTDCGTTKFCLDRLSNPICTAQLKLGDSCPYVFFDSNQQRQCGSSAWCSVSRPFAGENGTCIVRGTMDTACKRGNQWSCQDGLTCLGATEKCGDKLQNGQTCYWGIDCLSGTCDSDKCTGDVPTIVIPTNLPTNFVPTKPAGTVAPGSPCRSTDSFSCDDFTFCDETASICKPSLKVGDACDTKNAFFSNNRAKQCGSMGYCNVTQPFPATQGTCVTRGTQGQTCDATNKIACMDPLICRGLTGTATCQANPFILNNGTNTATVSHPGSSSSLLSIILLAGTAVVAVFF